MFSRGGTESQVRTTSRTSVPAGTVTLPDGPEKRTSPSIRPSRNTRTGAQIG